MKRQRSRTKKSKLPSNMEDATQPESEKGRCKKARLSTLSEGADVPSEGATSDAYCNAKESIDEFQSDYLSPLSLEVVCHILDFLPLYEIMKLESLCKKLNEAVSMHLRLCTEIDFTEGELYGHMPLKINDDNLIKFLKRCPELLYLYGLHPQNLAKRRQRDSDSLSVPGVVAALELCPNLQGVETCDIFLLEAIISHLPRLEILGIFKNRNGRFPIPQTSKFSLTRNAKITSLHLTGCVIPDLPRMDYLKHLYMRWVQLTDPHPFRDFGVPMLKTFVMSNCAGPQNALKYVPLITGLAAARSLSRLELVRVPFLGGLIQHVVEDSWRMQGFRNLQKIVIGTCKHALEVDLGYLTITCSHRLEEVAVQPSMTKDSFFSSLTLAAVDFPVFETLHLGFVDDFPPTDKWSNEELVNLGLADITEAPANLTDIGMKAVGQTFPNLKLLTVYQCPHLHYPTTWFTQGMGTWARLKELHLRKCHAVRLEDLCLMIPLLPALESLYLEQMFREPPKGCSRVGLSAGTGLGVSSALVSNTGNDVVQGAAANQQPANNNNAPAPAN